MRYAVMAHRLSSYRLPELCKALQGSRSDFYRCKIVKREVCAVDKIVSNAFAQLSIELTGSNDEKSLGIVVSSWLPYCSVRL